MDYESKLLAAIEAWEELGNDIDEFGNLLFEACFSRTENGYSAKKNLLELPYGKDIYEVENGYSFEKKITKLPYEEELFEEIENGYYMK